MLKITKKKIISYVVIPIEPESIIIIIKIFIFIINILKKLKIILSKHPRIVISSESS